MPSNRSRLLIASLLAVLSAAPLRAENPWTIKPPRPTRGFGYTPAAVVMNGLLYAVGGSANGQCVSAVEAYDPAKDVWTQKSPLPTPGCAVSVMAFGDKIYAIGGSYDSPAVLVYDPASDSWTPGVSLPTGRVRPALATVNGLIFVIGGTLRGNFVDTVEIYEPAEGAWSVGTPMPTPTTRDTWT